MANAQCTLKQLPELIRVARCYARHSLAHGAQVLGAPGGRHLLDCVVLERKPLADERFPFPCP